MNYQVHITSIAERDIVQAVDYIEYSLKNPDAAEHLLASITEKVDSLSVFPKKSRLVDDPVLASWGIRFILIQNYIAFYTIDETENRVIVVRFLYQKRNWISILRHSISGDA